MGGDEVLEVVPERILAGRDDRSVRDLQPERVPEGFIYEDATETLTPAPQPGTMKDAALGLVLWGSLAYQQGLYRTAQDSRLALN